ncbi:MAG: hypothetical protein WCW33_03490 [Candidatus Babeliales bacterium]|jgi:hypothetical protein
MKRTTGLLIALMTFASVNAAATESVVPQEVCFGQDDELVLDEAMLKEFDKLEKETPSKMLHRFIAALSMMKDHAIEYKWAYIAGTVTLAAVIIWYSRRSGVSDIPRSDHSAHPDMPQITP